MKTFFILFLPKLMMRQSAETHPAQFVVAVPGDKPVFKKKKSLNTLKAEDLPSTRMLLCPQ